MMKSVLKGLDDWLRRRHGNMRIQEKATGEPPVAQSRLCLICCILISLKNT